MSQKIAYFIPTLKLAGTSTQALAFCDAMAADGHEIELVVATKTGVFLDSVDEKTYPIHYLHSAKIFRKIISVITLFLYILKRKPTVVISGAKRINKLAIYAHLLSFKRSKLVVILTNDLLQRQSHKDKGRRISRI